MFLAFFDFQLSGWDKIPRTGSIYGLHNLILLLLNYSLSILEERQCGIVKRMGDLEPEASGSRLASATIRLCGCGQVGFLWTSGFVVVVVVVFSTGKMSGWAGSHLMHKAAMQHCVTDFWQRGMTHLLTVSLMHALCLALYCTFPQGVTHVNNDEL